MRVFLSYSTQDQLDADALRRALLGRRPELDIYFAPHRNEVGAYWIARLDEELAAADAVVLVLGERVGPWQELEYFDALRRNRAAGRPLLAPVLVGEAAPGLPFLDHFHRLDARRLGMADVVDGLLAALDGQSPGEPVQPWQQLNPYRGLLAMETQDAAYFFGRELLSTRVLGAMAVAPNHIHTLVGNSGVGKSSLAQAGVIGALRSQLWPSGSAQPWPEALADSRAWPVVRLSPGSRPLLSLARAFVALWRESADEIEQEAHKWQDHLADGAALGSLLETALSRVAFRMDAEPPQRVLLYLDQAEELYSRADPLQAQRFSALMAEAAASHEVLALMSLRADYYGRLQNDAALYPVVRTVDVPPLDRTGIERVVRLPAGRLGARFESEEAVQQIVSAAARQPAALPMLSDLLADAWREMQEDARADGVLRLPPGFVDISRPLADKAERFLAGQPDSLDLLRRLFTLKLALLPREGQAMRRRARRSECGEAEWRLIEAMAGRQWRLLTLGREAGEATAEVAHEALLRHWPRVVRWLDDAREFLVWKSRFEADYRSWEEAGELIRERTLLTGLALDVAVRWKGERAADLTAGERLYIEESVRAAEAAGERERAAQRRLQRQRRLILALVFGALLVVGAIALHALDLRDQARHSEKLARLSEQQAMEARRVAEEQRQAALREADLANARRLAGIAGGLFERAAGETTLAALLAAESMRRSATSEGREVLRRALDLLPPAAETLDAPWPHARLLVSGDAGVVAFARHLDDGTPGPDSEVSIRRGTAKDAAVTLAPGRLATLALSPGGELLATVRAGDGVLAVWDTKSGKPRFERPLEARSVQFSADGKRLLVRAAARQEVVLDAHDGREVARIGMPAGVDAVRLQADRRTLVSFGADRHFRAWDGVRARALWTSSEARPDAEGVVLSDDGRRFADLSADGRSIEIGDTASGHAARSIPVGERGMHQLSADGSRLLWLTFRPPGQQDELQLWNTEDGSLVHRRPLHHSMRRVEFLPGSDIVALSAGRSSRDEAPGYVELIDAADGKSFWRAPWQEGFARVMPMGPDMLAVSGGRGGRLLTPPGELPATLGDAAVVAALSIDAVQQVALARRSPDAAGDGDRIEIRSRDDGALLRSIETGARVALLAADADGERLFAVLRAEGGEWVRAWRLDDGSRLGGFRVDGSVVRLWPLAGGERLALRSRLGELTLWRLSDGTRYGRFSHLAAADRQALAAAAPRALTEMSGTLQLWDLDDGRELARLAADAPLEQPVLSPDGRRVAWLAQQGNGVAMLRSWQPPEAPADAALRLVDPRALFFSPDGQQLLARLGRGELQLIDAAALEVKAQLQPLPGGQFVRARFAADGSALLAEERAEGRRALRVFALPQATEVARFDLDGSWLPWPAGQVARVDADGGWAVLDPAAATADLRLLTAAPENFVRSRGAGRLIASIPAAAVESMPQPLRESVVAAPGGEAAGAPWALDGRGDRLALVGEDGVAIVDARDGRRIAHWPEVRFEGAGIAVGPHLRPVRGLQFIGGGDGVAAFDTTAYGLAEQSSRLWLWHWSDGPALLINDGNPVNGIAASRDGAWLASAEGALSRDGSGEQWHAVGRHQLRIWDARSGELLRTLPFESPVDAVAFSPDGSLLAARGSQRVRVFSTGDWELRAEFPLEGEHFVGGGVVFADDQWVAASAEQGVWLWAVSSGERRLLPHKQGWERLEPVSGGRLLSHDRSGASLWSLPAGELLFRYQPPVADGGVLDAFVAEPSGELLIVDGGGLLRPRWQAGELLAEVCRRLTRDFSDTEWSLYVGAERRPGPCAGG